MVLLCVEQLYAHNVPMSEEMPVAEPVAKNPQSPVHRFYGLREKLSAAKLEHRKAHNEVHDVRLFSFPPNPDLSSF